jgi:hypothetical protein
MLNTSAQADDAVAIAQTATIAVNLDEFCIISTFDTTGTNAITESRSQAGQTRTASRTAAHVRSNLPPFVARSKQIPEFRTFGPLTAAAQLMLDLSCAPKCRNQSKKTFVKSFSNLIRMYKTTYDKPELSKTV